MKLILPFLILSLACCKRAPQEEKEYVTPEEKKVIDEMSKGDWNS